MKKLFYFLLLITLATHSCSKDSSSPVEIEDNLLFLSDIVVSHEPIGIGQSLLIEIEEPEDAGAVVTYKWVVKDPEGETKEYFVHQPYIEYEVLLVGKHEVKLDVASKTKEGSASSSFNTVESDFGLAVFGNSPEVIERSKYLNGDKPSLGLTNFYWPFEAEKPSEKLRYENGLLNENYLFANNEFIAGSIESYNNKFSTSMNGISRNMAYYHYLSSIVSKFDAVFITPGKTEMVWREGVTEQKKKEYEEKYGSTKEDGYGWALMNRDMKEIRTVWEEDGKEAEAVLEAMNNNSLYQFRGSIRKK